VAITAETEALSEFSCAKKKKAEPSQRFRADNCGNLWSRPMLRPWHLSRERGNLIPVGSTNHPESLDGENKSNNSFLKKIVPLSLN